MTRPTTRTTTSDGVRAAATPGDERPGAGRRGHPDGQRPDLLRRRRPTSTLDCHAASNFAGGIGNQVTVTVAQPFSFLTPLIGDVFGGSLTLHGLCDGAGPQPARRHDPAGSPMAPCHPDPTRPPRRPRRRRHPPRRRRRHSPPGATPTPTPTPTPDADPHAVPTCTVPDFRNAYWNNVGGIPALQVWQSQASPAP